MDGATARSGQTQQAGATPDLDPNEIGADGLSRREREILSFERQWWKYAGAKEEAIKELFGLSATRYYQVLNALVDRPEALAADVIAIETELAKLTKTAVEKRDIDGSYNPTDAKKLAKLKAQQAELEALLADEGISLDA